MLERTLKAAIPEAAKLMAEPAISKIHRPAEAGIPEVSGEEVSVLKVMPAKAGTVNHPILPLPVTALVAVRKQSSRLQAGVVVAQADAARSAVLPQPREQVEVEGVNKKKDNSNNDEA
jgi:hypothetical protein